MVFLSNRSRPLANGICSNLWSFQVCVAVTEDVCKDVPREICEDSEHCKDVPKKDCHLDYKEVRNRTADTVNHALLSRH